MPWLARCGQWGRVMRLTGSNPDWTQAPPWALWWTCDQDGEAFWYECRPRLGAKMWFRVGGRARLADAVNPHCVNWRKAVQRYPQKISDRPGRRGE